MENFNLKKFLVENKLTTSSRSIQEIIQSDPETITQAFQKAGVDLSAPVTIEADYGHSVDQKDFATGQEALSYLEDMRAEGEADNPNYNEEEGIAYEYGDEISLASWSEGGSVPKLAVNFSDGASYFIIQEDTSSEEDLEENAAEGQDVSGQVVTHATEALKVIEEFKAANQISSNESDFNEIEAMLEEIIERLSK